MTNRQPSINRRLFFIQGGALASLGVVTAIGLPSMPMPGGPSPGTVFRPLQRLTLDMLTKSTFDECLGQAFRLHLDSGEALRVELIESAKCGSSGSKIHSDQRDAFSLVFRAPKNASLPQQIYRLEHERIGPLEIFLVPIGPDELGMRLEAVFT